MMGDRNFNLSDDDEETPRPNPLAMAMLGRLMGGESGTQSTPSSSTSETNSLEIGSISNITLNIIERGNIIIHEGQATKKRKKRKSKKKTAKRNQRKPRRRSA